METRKIKRVPIVMDLLYDDLLDPAEVIGAINKLSEQIRSSKEHLLVNSKNLIEVRFLSVGRVLIVENFQEGTKKLTEL